MPPQQRRPVTRRTSCRSSKRATSPPRTIEEDGCWGTASFTSFLSLVKFDGRWLIVAKVFAHVSGALPS